MQNVGANQVHYGKCVSSVWEGPPLTLLYTIFHEKGTHFASLSTAENTLSFKKGINLKK